MLFFFYYLVNVSVLYLRVDHCFHLLFQRCICYFTLLTSILFTYFANYRQHVPFFLVFLTKAKCIPFSCPPNPFYFLTRGIFLTFDLYLTFVALRHLHPKVFLALTSLKGEEGLILAEAYLLVLGGHTRGETC